MKCVTLEYAYCNRFGPLTNFGIILNKDDLLLLERPKNPTVNNLHDHIKQCLPYNESNFTGSLKKKVVTILMNQMSLLMT
jgi:hypothetical protein